MRNIKLIIEYDGTDFHGWQVQPNGRTVQEDIEGAIYKLSGTRLRITGSGRTDAGVHARMQVANFKIDSTLPIHAFRDGLNSRLPKDVKIIAAEEVSLDFNARFDARRRSYRYQIIQRHSPLLRRVTWHVKGTLNIERMQTAASLIIGAHDFEAFSLTRTVVENFTVEVYESSWVREGELLVFKICANRFLYSMVRKLVGAFVDIGRGKIEPEAILVMIAEKDRTKTGQSAPAVGLILERVEY